MMIRRTIYYLPTLLALAMLAGCGAEADNENLPGGGVDATTGRIVIDDIWVDGPHGLSAGAAAPLRLAMTNESKTTNDALVGVSTPVAQRATLEHDGHPVARIEIAADTQTDLEWHTGVQLEDLRRSLAPGQYFPITLTFAHAAPVTVQATVGQLPQTHVPHGAGNQIDWGTL